MRKRTTEDQKLADDARLLRAWRQWHCEQLQLALTGMHRDVLERLVDFIAVQNWEAIDYDTRQIALHEIATAITRLRERKGLPPFNDALPSECPTAFQIIRKIILLSAQARGSTGTYSGRVAATSNEGKFLCISQCRPAATYGNAY
jgi:hypothetical protein